MDLHGGEICLVDSGTTHTIFKDKRYFSQLKLAEAIINTISGASKLIEGSGRACIILPNGTKITISDALYSSRSQRNLLSFRDIRKNGYHIETMSEYNKEYLCITSLESGNKHILEKLPSLSSGLYYTRINSIESNYVVDQKLLDPKSFILWHDRLGHPGATMMRRIIETSNGHPLKNQKIFSSNEISCAACAQEKLITRPSPVKIDFENPKFLERIQGDICGPISPSC